MSRCPRRTSGPLLPRRSRTGPRAGTGCRTRRTRPGDPGRPGAVSQVLDAGSQPAVGQQPGGLARFGSRGRVGILDVGELRVGQLRGLALGVAGRHRHCQPAQQRPQLPPVAGAVGHRRPQRRPGLLGQCAQPLRRVEPGRLRFELLVELVAHDAASLRLQVDEAGRPGKSAGGSQNPLMGPGPPGRGLRPAGQGISQVP